MSSQSGNPGPGPAPLPQTRTLGSLGRLLMGPVMFVVAGLAVFWVQEQRGLVPAPGSANFTAVEPLTCDISETDALVQRFSQFLQFKTVGSTTSPDHIAPENKDQFQAAVDWMEKQYPLVWEHLQVEKVGKDGWSRLLTWHGSDSTLAPVLYVSHYDVVPVAAEKEKDWTYGPFDGKVVDGVVWGRGALDIKFSVTSMLEAVTRLMQQGYQPRRSIMFCFGHDEELGGNLGAGLIAPLLEQRGVKLDLIIDEGGVIFSDGIKGITSHPVALVGTAEKAYTSLELTFHSSGGHSSMPPTDLSDVVSQFSRFIMHLQANKPPLEMRQPTSDFLKALAPYSPEKLGVKYMQPLLGNADRWPLSRWLAEVLAKSGPESAAIVRTTVVATKVHAGVADNVLPQAGTITLNIRSHPDIPRQDIVDYVSGILATGQLQADIRVTNATFFGPPGMVTPTDGRHYQMLKQAIQEYWRAGDEPVAVAPYLLTGGTDSKHFAGLTSNGILRFVPYRMLKTPPPTDAPGGMGAVSNIHATNERVLVEDYVRSICTYQRIFTLFSEA